jgi:hypothetical protein
MFSSAPTTELDYDTVVQKLGIDATKTCRTTGIAEDAGAYTGSRTPVFLNTLFLPWDITMNNRAGTYALEIGFLFLIFVPAFFFWKKTIDSEPFLETNFSFTKSGLLTIYSISYFLLWGLYANNILWYALPGFLFLILLVVPTVTHQGHSPWLARCIWLVFFAGLIFNILVRLEYFHNKNLFLYAGGFVDEQAYIEMSFPGYLEASNLLNSDSGERVLLTASKVFYFIDNNDTRVLPDQFLDTFSCLDNKHDDNLTLENLQKFEVRYIFFSRDYLQTLQTTGNSTFRAKVERFVNFADKNLKVVLNKPAYILLSVPRQ